MLMKSVFAQAVVPAKRAMASDRFLAQKAPTQVGE